jgi:Bacteriophage probable baseplate hub protein
MPTDANSGGGALISARPSIVVDGQDKPELTGGLLALRIHDGLESMASCEATFGNWGARDSRTTFLYFDRSLLDFGKRLQVKFADTIAFDGRITSLEAQFPEGAAPSLAVLAEDRLQDLRMTRRTRTFADMTDADVLSQIAQDHGLTPQVDLDGPNAKVITQLNQSDMAFMRERARSIGGEVWVENTDLHAAKRSDRTPGGDPPKLGYGAALHAFSASADLAHQRTSVTVTGWDVSGKQALSEQADDAALSGELGNDTSGASVLKSALGDRGETVSGSVPLTSDEARARGEALFRRRARRFVSGRGIADGDARLAVGRTVRLEGLGPLFSGDFYVAEVTHRFDSTHGLRTEFAVERPGLGSAA